MFKQLRVMVLVAAFLGGLANTPAAAAVLFNDSFNSQADWQPHPANNAVAASTECSTPGQLCNPLPPTSWSYYRATGLWWDGDYNDTIRISSTSKDGVAVGRGGSGKAFVVYNESNSGASGDGWGADGILTKKLPEDQNDLYARVWIRTQSDWRWPLVADMMVKMFRVYHYDGSGSIFLNGSGGNNAPVAFFDFKHSNTYGTRYMNTLRCSPQSTVYACTTAVPLDALMIAGDSKSLPTASGMLGDTGWHSVEFHLRMNSYNTATSTWNSDGVYQLWYDGVLKENYSNIQWKRAGSDLNAGWNTISLGGNAYNTFADPVNKAEQWYAMDDFVVSTAYTGPPAKPASVTAQPVAAKTVRVTWAPGTNGASYSVNGYRIYYGTDAANLTSTMTVGNVTQADVADLQEGKTYYFAVAAFNKGEADVNENQGVKSTVASVMVPVTAATADTVAPVASISSPANGSTVSGTVTINVAATDNVAVSKVEFYLNGSIFGVVGSAPYALTWNTINNANATYTLTTKAYDAAGNVGQASSSVAVKNAIADLSAPVISTFTMPASVTSLTVPVSAFAVSDDIGVTGYQITESATAPAAGATTWKTSAPTSFTFSVAGSRTAYAWCKDASGKVSATKSASVAITLPDIIAPVVNITSPATNSQISGTVAVEASATDDVSVSKVEFYLNNILKATATASPYSFSWNTTTVANGPYVVTAKAYDAAGNVGQFAGVSLYVSNDTTAPSVSIVSPVAGSTIGGAVSVSANASDNLAVEKVELYLNGALQATSTTAPYGFNWNTANAANGSYTVSAKAYDAAGNIGQTSATVTVFNDTIAPSVSIASPVAGSTIGGAVPVSATASDNVAVEKVELYLNGALQATSTTAPYGFNWNTANAANGSYTVSAMAYDAAGNIGQTSATVTVFNDTIAPSVSIASPVAGSTIGGTVSVSASASDNVAVKKVELYLNDALVATSTAAPYGFSWNTANAANGSYTVSAKAYDAAGNIGQASATVNVFNDASAPSVSIASPIAGSTVNSTVSLYANASDNVGVTKVEFYVDGALQATSTAAPYGFSWNTATVANGAHTVSAKAYDAAGNVGQSANLSVNVLNDTVAPVISVSAPTKDYLTSSKLTISASAKDNVAVVKMEAYVDNALVLSTSNSSFSISTNIAKGVHTVTIKAYDASNNVAVSSKTVNRFF